MDIRDKRLLNEYRLMKTLLTPQGLIDFRCARLTDVEGKEYLKSTISVAIINNGHDDFLPPNEFDSLCPDEPPEKYQIIYNCKGLKSANTADCTNCHVMEVVYGWDYPTKPPTFVWLTPIWHPNFKLPHICLEGRPFTADLSLKQVVMEVGKMVQYRSYNLTDPLNRDAATWTRANEHLLPIDTRDLLDKTVDRFDAPHLAEIVADGSDADEDLVALLDEGD